VFIYWWMMIYFTSRSRIFHLYGWLIDWLIDWLIIYGFTSRSRIFHLYGDVTIAGEGLQNLSLCSALRAFELVTTGSDGRHEQPTLAHPNRDIYHPWKFHDSIFHHFWENGKAIFEFVNSISHHRKWLFQNYFHINLDIFSVNNIY
jgi:hypothetical protein